MDDAVCGVEGVVCALVHAQRSSAVLGFRVCLASVHLRWCRARAHLSQALPASGHLWMLKDLHFEDHAPGGQRSK